MIPLACPVCEADVPSRIKRIAFPPGAAHRPTTPRRNLYICAKNHEWYGAVYTDEGTPLAIDRLLFGDTRRSRGRGEAKRGYTHQGHVNLHEK